MHFEVLAEDASGGKALEVVMQKILGANYSEHSWKIHPYKGLGRIPPDLRGTADRRKRILLEWLPSQLRGYGRSLNESCSVLVVVDLDDKDCMAFKRDLLDVLDACNPRPRTLFRIAIEESEAWLLGDPDAVRTAYPNTKDSVLDGYEQDSICGTWEVLADAVNSGGAAPLKKAGYPELGKAKCEWAERIARHMNIDKNRSKSFQVFRDGVRNLAGIGYDSV